jgi:hypothetical protein
LSFGLNVEPVGPAHDTRPERLAEAAMFRSMKAFSTKPREMVFAALLLLHMVPLWGFDYFPSQDGLSHLYNATIIRNYTREEFAVYREFYTLQHTFGVNWLIHLVLAGLMELVPILTAEKILLTGYALLFMLSLRYAVLSVNDSSLAIAFLGFPLIYNRSLHMGFYSFIFGLAMFLFCIGHWVRRNRDIGCNRALVSFVVISLLLYLTHIISLIMAIAVIGIMTAWLVILESLEIAVSSSNPPSFDWQHLWLLLKPRLWSTVAFVPSILLVGLFLHDKHAGLSVLEDLKIGFRQLLSFQRTEAAVMGALLATLMLLAILNLKDRAARFRLERSDGFLLVAAFVLFVYILAPDVLFGGALIRERLLLYVILLSILWVAGQTYGHVLSRLIAGVASAIAISGLVVNLPQYKNFNEYFHEYVSAGEFIDPHTNLLPVSFTYYWPSHDVDWFTSTAPNPLVHVSGYIAAAKTLIDLGNYEAATGHFPTVFRPQLNPYRYLGTKEDPLKLNIEGYQDQVGKHVDYVLLMSTRSIEQELRHASDLYRQLNAAYRLIYTSPRDFARLYRRSDYKASPRFGIHKEDTIIFAQRAKNSTAGRDP